MWVVIDAINRNNTIRKLWINVKLVIFKFSHKILEIKYYFNNSNTN